MQRYKISTRDYEAYDKNIVFLLSNRVHTRSPCQGFPHLYLVVILDLHTPLISHGHNFEKNNFYVISKLKNSICVFKLIIPINTTKINYEPYRDLEDTLLNLITTQSIAITFFMYFSFFV